jgi:hypothetical protein
MPAGIFSAGLLRRHLDRIAVSPSGRHAFVSLARIDHRVGKPESDTNKEHEPDQQNDVREPSIAFFVLRRLWIAHLRLLARGRPLSSTIDRVANRRGAAA